MAAVPETWSERAKVAIALESGLDIAFESLTESIDVDIGDKAIETIKTTKGGRLVKYSPQEDTTITLEAYPLEAGTSSANKTAGATGTGFFDLMNSSPAIATQPLSTAVDFNRDRARIVILWTNDTANTTAQSAVTLPARGMRIVGCGFITSVKPSFTDGVLKFSITMTCPAFTKNAVANVKIDSTDGLSTMPALAAFTPTANW